MDQIESNRSREALAQGLFDAFKATIQGDPELTAIGPISASFGEIRFGNFVCAYTDNPFVNVLDIWFGRIGGRAGHPGEVQFEADPDNNQWVNHYNQQERFTNEKLVEFCIARLREVEAAGY